MPLSDRTAEISIITDLLTAEAPFNLCTQISTFLALMNSKLLQTLPLTHFHSCTIYETMQSALETRTNSLGYVVSFTLSDEVLQDHPCRHHCNIQAYVGMLYLQKLPSKFVERYGAKVSKKVWLEVPTGAKWRVEVKKKKDEIWLRKGWYKFAESLGIKYGHFLVFDYDAMHAVFNVVAIDMSATEIEYPTLNIIDDVDEEEDQGGPHSLFVTKRLKVEEDENEEDSDVVLVNTNDGDVGRKRRNKAQSPFYASARKKSKPSSSRNMQVDNIYGNRRPIDQSDAQKVETGQTTIKRGYYGKETILDSKGRIQCVIQGRNQTSAQTEKAVERARDFRAEEPVCIIALQPSYVCPQKKCHLHFPASFIVAYVNLKIKDVMLRTNDGRTWTLKYYVTESQHVSFLTSGWKKFAIDNDLKAGDVCLFELIKGAENALKVVVFRVTDEDEAPI